MHPSMGKQPSPALSKGMRQTCRPWWKCSTSCLKASCEMSQMSGRRKTACHNGTCGRCSQCGRVGDWRAWETPGARRTARQLRDMKDLWLLRQTEGEKATVTQHHPCNERQRSATSSAPLSTAGETMGRLHAEHTLSELAGFVVLGGGCNSRQSSCQAEGPGQAREAACPGDMMCMEPML